VEEMNTFICGKCGYLAFEQAPDTCPVCGAPRQAFKLDTNAIKKPSDPNNLTDLEKKHIPVIEINKQCGLVGQGCVDVHIKIGEILHVMETKHYIMYIDVYLDRAFIARFHLTAEKLNPVLGLHLKVAAGKLLALENCNIHGRWVSEVDI
jgi:superoxide reductase